MSTFSIERIRTEASMPSSFDANTLRNMAIGQATPDGLLGAEYIDRVLHEEFSKMTFHQQVDTQLNTQSDFEMSSLRMVDFGVEDEVDFEHANYAFLRFGAIAQNDFDSLIGQMFYKKRGGGEKIDNRFFKIEQDFIHRGENIGSVDVIRTGVEYDEEGRSQNAEFGSVSINLNNGNSAGVLPSIQDRNYKVFYSSFESEAQRSGVLYIADAFESLSSILTFGHEKFHLETGPDSPGYAMVARDKIYKLNRDMRFSWSGHRPNPKDYYFSPKEAIALLQEEFRPWKASLDWAFDIYNQLGISSDQLVDESVRYAESAFATYYQAVVRQCPRFNDKHLAKVFS